MNIILLFFQDNELKDVLRMMLDMSPTKRPSVSEILLHPCFHQEETIALEVIERKDVQFEVFSKLYSIGNIFVAFGSLVFQFFLKAMMPSAMWWSRQQPFPQLVAKTQNIN